ncbi:hypothetical protein [Gluconacetobacter diazotrophicus]|nr:hypothetical protein [Gluconacetobacter diazotrophicus]
MTCIFRSLAAALLAVGVSVPVVACTTTGGTATISTAELSADAGAIAYAAQAIEAIPTLSSHLSTDQVAQVNDALAQIKTITAQISAASGGTIDINTGKGWASSLATEFQVVLTVAGTVASTLDPAVAGYIKTAEQIIPLIEAAAGLTPATVSLVATAPSAPAIRADLYRGI